MNDFNDSREEMFSEEEEDIIKSPPMLIKLFRPSRDSSEFKEER